MQSRAVVAIVVQALAQVGDMRFIAFGLSQLVKQVLHMFIEIPFELVDHLWVVVLLNVLSDELGLLLLKRFAGLILGFFFVVFVFSLYVLEEADDHSREIVAAH